ncbi:hypothetical protein ES703_45929 [subsurface metagenome]
MIGKPIFDPREVDPFAWMIGEKLARGTLNCGSIGFKALRIEVVPERTRRDDTRLIIKESELFEFSIVNVPTLVSSEAIREKPRKGTFEYTGKIETVADRLMDSLGKLSEPNKFENIFRS